MCPKPKVREFEATPEYKSNQLLGAGGMIVNTWSDHCGQTIFV